MSTGPRRRSPDQNSIAVGRSCVLFYVGWLLFWLAALCLVTMWVGRYVD